MPAQQPSARGRRLRAELARLLSASRRAESRYVLDLIATLRAVHRHVEQLVEPQLPHPTERHDAVKMPEGLEGDIARHVRRKVGVAFDRMAEQLDRNGQRAMNLLGIHPHAPGVLEAISEARERNIQLVEKAGRSYAGDVREVFEAPKNEGLRVEELRDLLHERGRVSVSRATLIARDQTLKLNAGLNETRARAAGVEKFVWSTSKDERVRPEHRELDGETFEYDDPPEADVDGSPCLPGQAINCRCVAIPVLPELEEEPEEPDYLAEAAE